MTDISYSAALRDLSEQHSNRTISLAEYRQRRRAILNKIDEEFNGNKSMDGDMDEQFQEPQEDASIFMKTIAFFKNKKIE